MGLVSHPKWYRLPYSNYHTVNCSLIIQVDNLPPECVCVCVMCNSPPSSLGDVESSSDEQFCEWAWPHWLQREHSQRVRYEESSLNHTHQLLLLFFLFSFSFPLWSYFRVQSTSGHSVTGKEWSFLSNELHTDTFALLLLFRLLVTFPTMPHYFPTTTTHCLNQTALYMYHFYFIFWLIVWKKCIK